MNAHHAITTQQVLLFHQISTNELDFVRANNDGHSRSNISITTHAIKETPSGSVIGAGRLLSEFDKQALRDFLNGEEEMKSGWIPENVMMMNSKRMVWYVPSKIRPMHFLTKDGSIHYSILWPSLVFCFDAQKRLRVATFMGNRRPRLDQKLFHAPIWNVDSNGVLCAGSNTTTQQISIEAMQIWEEAIFKSNFSHRNHDKVLAVDTPYLKFIKQKSNSGERITAKELTPINKTLQDWVEGK